MAKLGGPTRSFLMRRGGRWLGPIHTQSRFPEFAVDTFLRSVIVTHRTQRKLTTGSNERIPFS